MKWLSCLSASSRTLAHSTVTLPKAWVREGASGLARATEGSIITLAAAMRRLIWRELQRPALTFWDENLERLGCRGGTIHLPRTVNSLAGVGACCKALEDHQIISPHWEVFSGPEKC